MIAGVLMSFGVPFLQPRGLPVYQRSSAGRLNLNGRTARVRSGALVPCNLVYNISPDNGFEHMNVGDILGGYFQWVTVKHDEVSELADFERIRLCRPGGAHRRR